MGKTRCHYGCWYGKRCTGISRQEMLEVLEDRYNLNVAELNNITDSEIQAIADSISNSDGSNNLGHIKDDFKLGYNN